MKLHVSHDGNSTLPLACAFLTTPLSRLFMIALSTKSENANITGTCCMNRYRLAFKQKWAHYRIPFQGVFLKLFIEIYTCKCYCGDHDAKIDKRTCCNRFSERELAEH